MISRYARRKLVDRIAKVLMPMAAMIGLFFLGWILWTALTHGIQALNLSLFINDTPAPGTGMVTACAMPSSAA
jgi:hypothetical protein